MVCSIDGCGGEHYARTWCHRHYRRWQRWGDPLMTRYNTDPVQIAERRRRASKEAAQRYRDKIRVITATAKAVPCADCGLEWPSYVMHFDHVRGVKLFTIAHATRQHVTIAQLLAEIAKCDVVCGNCHAIRTHERDQYSASG